MKSSSEDPGREAELRLQLYRHNLHLERPLAATRRASDAAALLEENRAALAWIEELAGSGHWGARLILRRVASDSDMPGQLALADPDAATRLARISPAAAYKSAWAEAHRPSPDWPRLREWLGFAKLGSLAAEIAEAERQCGELEARDIERVRTAVIARSTNTLLVDMAEWRQGSDDPAHRGRARPLVDAAARMGSRRALQILLDNEWAAARDRAALAESWCARYEAHVPAAEVRALLRVGAPLSQPELGHVKTALGHGVGERGALLLQVARDRHGAGADPEVVSALLYAAAEAAERPEIRDLWESLWKRSADRRAILAWWFERFPDFDLDKERTFLVGLWIEKSARGDEAGRQLAAQWYARAKETRLEPGAPVPRGLCYFVAAYLSPHVSFRFADEPGLSLEWLERGITLGNESCLDTWLASCVRGQLGLVPDPDAAMDRLRLMMRARPDQPDPLGGYTLGLAAIVAHADALLSGKHGPRDEPAARRWLEVGAQARYRKAIERLAALDRGI